MRTDFQFRETKRYSTDQKEFYYRNKHEAYVINIEDVSLKNGQLIKQEIIDSLDGHHDEAGLPVWLVYWRIDGVDSQNLPFLVEMKISDKKLIEDVILRIPEAKRYRRQNFQMDDFFKKKTSKVNRISRDRSSPPTPKIDRNKLPFGMREFANPLELHYITKFAKDHIQTVYPIVRTDIDLAKLFEVAVNKHIERFYPGVHKLDRYFERDIRRALTAMIDIEKLKQVPADVRAEPFKAMLEGRLLDIRRACNAITDNIRSMQA